MRLGPEFIAAAQAAMRATGVPASVSLAQCGVESAWGSKPIGFDLEPPVVTFNYFGIKAAAGQPQVTVPTHEQVHNQLVLVDAAFRRFASLEEAFTAHAALIAHDHRYAEAMAALPDLDRFIALMAAVYATWSGYGALLATIVRQDGLAQYDAGIGVTLPESDPTGAFGAAATSEALA